MNRLARWLLVGMLALSVAAGARAAAASTPAADAAELEMFVRPGCARCAEAELFVAQLRRERPALRVAVRDVRADPQALARLRELAGERGIGAPGVPSFLVGGELVVGYTGRDTTGERIRALLARRAPAAPAAGDAGSAAGTCAAVAELECAPGAAAAAETLALPWLDVELRLDDVGLPLFTVAIGLLDGFNPCSMWVLLMMISILAGSGDRRRMLAIAGTFVAVQGVAYFAFMAAWLNLFLLIGLSRASELALGAIAVAAGVINLKDFHALGRGITLSIPAAAKPGIHARLRRIVQQRSLLPAIAGTVVFAILVQLVELLCTSGFPAVYTRILTTAGLEPWTYYAYLLLYNLMYMLDDVAVLAVGVITLSRHRLQEREGRRLKLLAGAVLLALGVYLLLPHGAPA